jgi:nucleoside-diphosphate-sugar epimerase
MNIAVTGGSGRLGGWVIQRLLNEGDSVLSLDVAAPRQPFPDGVRFIQIDLTDLKAVKEAFSGCEGVIHLGGFPGPTGHQLGELYVNNTVGSYNVLLACSLLGIKRVSLASSINALSGLEIERCDYRYLPVDEKHPTFNQDEYGLSKCVLETQADSFARRHPDMTISSLRLHALLEWPVKRSNTLDDACSPAARGLWGWMYIWEAARAHVMALKASYTGQEIFFTTAQTSGSSIPSIDLAMNAYPDAEIRGDLSGHQSLYNCDKARRLLGWVHDDDFERSKAAFSRR